MRWEVLIVLAVLVSTAGMGTTTDGLEAEATTRAEAAQTDPGDQNQPGHPHHTWEELTLKLRELTQAHPEISRLHPGGESVLGLELWVVEIANVRDPGHLPLDQREVVWLDGGTHADEQYGTELSVDWIEFLLEGYGENETATWIVENRHTFIMPLVNPDGHHMDSRWNAHNVNINRNYPVGWGSTDEEALTNEPGPYPLSEPETRAVVDWWAKTEPDYMNSFHMGFDGMLYPWGTPAEPTPDAQVYERICEEIGEPDPNFCGPVHGIVGPTGGGSVDTSYARWGTVSFAYELGDLVVPYVSVQDPREQLGRYWDGVEHAFLNVEKYGANPVVEDVALDGDQVTLTVTNDGYGNLTHGHAHLDAPGTTGVTVELPQLGAGANGTVTAELPDAEDGRVTATLTYQERQVAELTETRTHPLPVAVDGGELVEAPLETPPTDEVLQAQSVSEENGAPGLGLLQALFAVAAVAALRRRG